MTVAMCVRWQCHNGCHIAGGDPLFDKFHVMRHLGEALDRLLKAE
jgi:hypothetical protein